MGGMTATSPYCDGPEIVNFDSFLFTDMMNHSLPALIAGCFSQTPSILQNKLRQVLPLVYAQFFS